MFRRFLLCLVLGFAILALISPLNAQVGYPLLEEFNSDVGFTQTAPSVSISGGQVHWNVSRSPAGFQQYVYRSIPAFQGDVRLTVRGQVNSWTSNCAVKAGIGDNPGVGSSVNFGFIGTGCGAINPTFPPGAIVWADGAALDFGEGPGACNYFGNWLRITPSTPFTGTLTIENGLATLNVPGSSHSTATGTPTYNGVYDTLYVGLTGDGDFPSCSGTIDSILVEPLNVNNPPNCSSATPSITSLWPPNHQFSPVTILGVTDPEADPITISIDSIFQDEPTNGTGDGDASPDGQGIGSATAEVRAERAGSGNGRFYHIGFTANDGNGGTCSSEVLVGAPKSQGNNGAPVDDGALFNSTIP